MTRSRIGVWMCAALIGLAAVACGGDDDSADKTTNTKASDSGGDRNAYVEAIVGASSDETTTGEQERCLAEAFVSAVGVDELVKAGVSPDDIRDEPDASPAKLGITFSDDQKEALWNGANDCVDIADLLVGSFAEGDVYTDEQVACFKDGFDEGLVKDLFLSSMTEGDDYQPSAQVTQQLTALMGKCGMAG